MRSPKTTLRAARAFSLTELLVVMALAGLVMALTVPDLRSVNDASAALRAAQQIESDFKRARMSAISQQQLTNITLNRAAMSYVVTPGGVSNTLPEGVSFAHLPGGLTEVALLAGFDFEQRGLLQTPVPCLLSIHANDQIAYVSVTPGGAVSASTRPPTP